MADIGFNRALRPEPKLSERKLALLRRINSLPSDVAASVKEAIGTLADGPVGERMGSYRELADDLGSLANRGYLGATPQFGGGFGYWLRPKGRAAIKGETSA